MTTDKSSEREALKPCPFCGGPARWGKCVPGEQEMENDGAEYIECEKCGASTCLVFPCMDSAKQPLADRWNARAALPQQAQETSLPPQGAASPDPQLLKFYAVSDYPSLVAAMLRHIEKLQAKLPKDGQPLLTRVRA